MRNHDKPAAVGGSSLLVIFAALCLIVFALLGLSTVLAEQRLSTASAESVTAYYQADTQAERILAQIRAGQLPDGVTAESDRHHYRCPISETQALEVTVLLTETSCEILQWQVVSTVQWDGESAPNLWDGNTGT